MKIRLEISHGRASVRNITLGRDSTIGRSSSCNLRIAAGVVSRRHCRIYIAGSKVLLRDLNSSNGTFIDGQRVPPGEDVSLPSDCKLSIGGIAFTVRYNAPVPVSPSQVVSSQEATIESPSLGDALPNESDEFPAEPPPNIDPEPDVHEPIRVAEGEIDNAIDSTTDDTDDLADDLADHSTDEATDTQEPVGITNESADDEEDGNSEIDRDTDYDPAFVSDDTELAEPDDDAPSQIESLEREEDSLVEAALPEGLEEGDAEGDDTEGGTEEGGGGIGTEEEIGFGFLTEAEAGSGEEPDSNSADDGSLGDFLNQF